MGLDDWRLVLVTLAQFTGDPGQATASVPQGFAMLLLCNFKMKRLGKLSHFKTCLLVLPPPIAEPVC